MLEELDKFENPMPNKSGYDFLCGIATAITEIENAPTVDAVEVVHGRWIVEDADSGELGVYAAFLVVNCSECGYDYSVESGQYGWYMGDPFPYNYCPNCGAKMDMEG